MPRVKEDTITDIKLGEYFGISPVTLTRWKKSDDKKLHERYKAFKNYFKKTTTANEEQKQEISKNLY